MFTINPFSELSGLISPIVMQIYVIAMVILVVGGTLLDTIHKKSAKYFFENSEKQKKMASRQVSGGEKVGIAIKTVAEDVMTSAEFCNQRRRVAHLLTMYGFVLFILSTAVLIFGYANSSSAGAWPLLWHLGALMVCVGGYWFWFAIRVDVAAEGNPWYRVVRADLFILALLATTTFALLWSVFAATFFFVLFIAAATVLFGTVFWSKFAHMFFKPAAAFQKRVTKADGSMENLPEVPDLTDPAVQERYPDIPEYLGKNPPDMGLGIKREAPSHY
jgi:ABC-type multidrug transport system fused ATPase/permease subunit